MPTDNQKSQTSFYPYPGLASFADRPEARSLFFAREKESQTLLEMVLSENLVLLFSRSGVGKTSLINAGLMEELRTRGFFPVVARLIYEGDPVKSICACIAEEAKRRQVVIKGVAETPGTLWEYFNEAQFLKEESKLLPVLVLDQFEELFTMIRPNGNREAAFVRDLADLARSNVPEKIRNRESGKLEKLDIRSPERRRLVSMLYDGKSPDIRILISIREDFLAEIETLKHQIPTVFRNSLRLEPLSTQQARAAIELPAERPKVLGENAFKFAPGVVDEMLDFLRIQRVGGKLIQGDSVEPVQLQILCKHFHRKAMEKKRDGQPGSSTGASGKALPEITLSDLSGSKGMERAIGRYYYDVLKRFPRFRTGPNMRKDRPSTFNFLLFNRPRAAIRHLCEKKLVTPGGYRNSISVDVIKSGIGVPEGDLSKLVDERLLRTEPRLGSYFYELSHDTLLPPLIKAARRKKRFYWVPVVSVLAFLLGVGIGSAVTVIKKVRDARLKTNEIAKLKNQVNDPEQTAHKRVSAARELLTSYKECSGCDFSSTGSPLDLHTINRVEVNLSKAELQRVNLGNAFVAFSDFREADLSNANLIAATLSFSNFTGATLTGANLSAATLRHSNFTRAVLTDTKLIGVDLTRADFTDAAISNTDFTDTIWWAATGLSVAQIEQMKRRWPPEKAAAGFKSLQQLASLSHQLEDLKTDEQNYRKEILNQRAWHRAIRGIELDKAYTDARDALSLDPSLDRAMDTLGYILLQLGKYPEALSYFQQSLETRKNGESDSYRVGLAHYHLALAFDRMGDQAQAQTHYEQAKQKGYRPSFECLLTPPSNFQNCNWPALRQSSS